MYERRLPTLPRRYLPLGEVCANGASLMGARSPLRCPYCAGLSHVQLTGRNAIVSLVILVAGVVLSYPSAISDALLAGVPHAKASVVRADILATAFVAAFFAFIFNSPLQKVERDTSVPRRSLSGSLSTLAFFGSVFLYGYFLFRS